MKLHSTKSLILLSGGLDSTTLLYDRLAHNDIPIALSFSYGQRHITELDYALATSFDLHIPHYIIDIHDAFKSTSDSALTNQDIPVPEGHYEAPTMRSTVVPNRNSTLLNIATTFAMSHPDRPTHIYTAIHAGDHSIYPDCRPSFINVLNVLLTIANETFNPPTIEAPYINIPKSDIVTRGHHLHVPYEHTYSCYTGNPTHCGRCGTCVERKEAFTLAHVTDPTHYQS